MSASALSLPEPAPAANRQGPRYTGRYPSRYILTLPIPANAGMGRASVHGERAQCVCGPVLSHRRGAPCGRPFMLREIEGPVLRLSKGMNGQAGGARPTPTTVVVPRQHDPSYRRKPVSRGAGLGGAVGAVREPPVPRQRDPRRCHPDPPVSPHPVIPAKAGIQRGKCAGQTRRGAPCGRPFLLREIEARPEALEGPVLRLSKGMNGRPGGAKAPRSP